MYAIINQGHSLLSWMVGISLLIFLLVCTLALMWLLPEYFIKRDPESIYDKDHYADGSEGRE